MQARRLGTEEGTGFCNSSCSSFPWPSHRHFPGPQVTTKHFGQQGWGSPKIYKGRCCRGGEIWVLYCFYILLVMAG